VKQKYDALRQAAECHSLIDFNEVRMNQSQFEKIQKNSNEISTLLQKTKEEKE